MRKTLLSTVVALILVSSVAFAAKMPEGSFLKHSVSNAAELAAQVTNDGLVASHYAKHFGISRNIVVTCFKDELRVGKLKSKYDAVVYTISNNLDIVTKSKTLRAGTYVFVDSSGRPVLEGTTGNPLVSRLPMYKMVSKSEQSLISSTSVFAMPAPVEAGAGSAATVGAVTPDVNVVVAPVVTESAVEIASAIPAVSTASKTGFVFPAAALLGGVVFAAGSGGGHGTVSSDTGPLAVMPEPSSLVALVMGASAFSLAYRRRK